jgi:GNAT superfamily N-acetyltransferase
VTRERPTLVDMPEAPVTFEAWSVDRTDEAAELLVARHAVHRAANPVLPALDTAWARQLLAKTPESKGLVALRGGDLVGYLTFTEITEGPRAGYAWSDLNDHAATDAETTRTLYAHAAEQLVGAGFRQHVVHVPAVDDLLWPWFLTSFGIQHTWSLRDSTPLELPPDVDDVVVRRIGPDEAVTAGQADLDLKEHLRLSPVFSTFPALTLEAATKEQLEFLEEPDVFAFVAERAGRHLGYGEITTDRKKDLRAPADSAILGIVVVDKGARGGGVGRTITASMLDWARSAGHQHVICDWRAGNLESSRAFTAFGWRPTFYRLYRSIV